MGLQVEDDSPTAPEPRFCLWPENEPLWNLWHSLQTQWRVGMAGREGFDYAGVSAYLRDVARIKPRKFQSVFTCMQVMERAALKEFQKQREE